MAADSLVVERRVKRWMVIGVSVTLALIVAGGYTTWHSYTTSRELAARQARVMKLESDVIHLDEVMSLTARVAAATGELTWEARYRHAEPLLDAAIEEIVALAPDPAVARFSENTARANAQLTEMELHALDLVRERDLAAARGVFGLAYEQHKQEYATGVASTIHAVSNSMQAEIDDHGRRVLVGICVAGCVLVITVLLWVRAVMQLRARQATLASALAASERDHQALAQAHRQLETLHAELIAKEKLSSLGMLAAGVAHEINNPMAYVTMNVHTMFEDMRDIPGQTLPDDLKIYVDELLPSTLDGIQRVNTIVRDLQQFARGDVDDAVPFDLNAEIAAASRISNNQVKGRARMELELAALPQLLGKPRQMTQVMVNLIVNAAHALGERTDGEIRISSALVADHAVVRIRDNGCGMSRETREQIFQPFFTTKGVGKGTGLGLSVAYGIVQAHGGEITVESTVGVGTCFTISLPVGEPLALAA